MKLYLKVVIHAIFWLVFLLFSSALSISRMMESWPLINKITPHFIINVIWAVIIFYLFYFYFIRFFEKRKFVVYLICSILASIGITAIMMPVHRLIVSFNIFDYRIFGPPLAGSFILA